MLASLSYGWDYGGDSKIKCWNGYGGNAKDDDDNDVITLFQISNVNIYFDIF